MKRLLFAFLFLFAIGMNYAQVNVTASGGDPSESYATLKAAFDSINTGFHTGTITIGISGSTTETATAVLNASGTGLSSYTSITISPSGGAARTISGAITAGSPLIDLSGADNVTFDGLNSGGNSLTISNTTASATSGTSTIRFINGATSNTITKCTVLGSFSGSATTNGGNIYFATDGSTTNGNDNNTVSSCDIGPAGANLSTKGIYGNGTTTATSYFNSGIIITGNNIYDYFGAAVSSGGVYVGGGCTDWTISNNKFYQTATRTQTTGAQHSAIWLAASSGNNFSISGNTIGYSSNTGTGTYTFVGVSSSSVLVPIFLSVGTTTVTSVQGNTIAAIAMSGAVSGTSSSAAFRGIYVSGGLTTIGDVTGNTIGSQSATGSITFTSSSSSAGDVIGIWNFGSSNWTVNNNTIGGITAGNSSTGAANIYGIRVNTSSTVTFACLNNTIGGSVANSIQSTSTATGTIVQGILNSNPAGTITGNTIRNLTAAGGTGTTTSASVAGIVVTSTSANHTLSQNTIYNLSNSNTTAATTVTGIQFTGGTANVVERNFIYALTSATNSATAEVNGIRVGGGTTIYRNNMIAIGDGISIALGGAATNSSTAGINGINGFLGTDQMFHNSVYIGGTATSGSGASYAFNGTQTVNTRSFRDNIFFNARTNSGATGKHYAVKLNGTTTNPTGLTINNNVYFANGTGAVFGFYNSLDVANLAAWKTAVGQDAGSFESNPQYNNPTAATPDLHIHPTNVTAIEGNGVDVGVTNDYDGQTRSGLTPVDIGADAGNFSGLDLSAPSIVYTALGNTASTSNRTLVATVTDLSGVPTSDPGMPRLYWKEGFDGTYTGVTPSYIGSNQYQYSFGGGVLSGDTVFYYFVARDQAGTPNLGSAPGGASGFAYDPPAASTPPLVPSSYRILPSISGTINVGIGQTYTTLTDSAGLFRAINNSVLTGNVTVNIVSDTWERGYFALNQWSEDGVGNYTLTIQPNAATMRTLSGLYSGGLIRLNGADRVTFDGRFSGSGNYLTVMDSSTGTTGAIQLISLGTGAGCNNVTIRNCTLMTNTVTGTSSYAVGIGGSTLGSAGDDNDNVSVLNNVIKRAYYGVYASASATGVNNDLTVTDNTIGGSVSGDYIGKTGIYAAQGTGGNISQNTIFNIITTISNPKGIDLSTGFVSATVAKNNIYSIRYTGTAGYGGKGIDLTPGAVAANITLSNNMISDLLGDGWTSFATDAIVGIKINSGTNYNIYHNSVNLTGDAVGDATACLSAALYLASGVTAVDVRDNILSNAIINSTSTLDTAYAIYTANATSPFDSINYNDYYAPTGGSFAGKVGYLGIGQVTLANWQAATGKDVNSISADPKFLGATNAHIDPNFNIVSNNGYYLASVTTDIDGDTRNNPPDIGADEYTYIIPSVNDPSNVSAKAANYDQINVSFTATALEANNVVIVWNATGTFTAPSGTPVVGNPLAGGTVLYIGQTSPYNHALLTANTPYYYKLFSYDGSNYSPGVAVSASTPGQIPFSENFNAGTSIPTGWVTNFSILGTHGKFGTNGLYKNIWSSAPSGNARLPYLGKVLSTSYLEFDYRIVNYSGYPNTATVLGTGNKIEVQISTDGTNYTTLFTIDNTNHTADTAFALRQVYLGSWADSIVYLNLKCTWASGDYYVDFDNVYVGPATVLPNPNTFTATAASASQINLAFTTNPNGNNVVIVWNNTGTFTTPTGAPPSVGSAFAGGTLLYNGTTSPQPHSGLFDGTTYYYKAFSYDGANYSVGYAANATTWCAVAALPYSQSFDGTLFPPNCWKITKVGSGNSWARTTSTPYSGAGVMTYTYNVTYAADAWAFTPGFALTGGTTYRVGFYQKTASIGGAYPEKLKVTVGSDTTVASQTTTIWNNAGGSNLTNETYIYRYADYTPGSNGTYYFAFNCYSDADMNVLYVDQVSVKPVPAVDLTLTNMWQSTGLPTPRPGENFSDYTVSMNKISDEKQFLQLDGSVSSNQESQESKTTILSNDNSIEGLMLNPITVKARSQNIGINSSSFTLNWNVGGTAQTPYSGPSLAPFAVDTASLTYSPASRGTFMTTGAVNAASDGDNSNDTSRFRMRVYPDTYTRTIYDKSVNTVDTYIGWNNLTTPFKAGVRYTAPSYAIKLAGVDFICRTEAVTAGNIIVQVRGANTTTSPGAVLYTKSYSGDSYFAAGESGDYIHFAFDNDAPTIAPGSDYWITVKIPAGILFPGGAHNSGFTAGRSFFEQSADTTLWSALVITTERAWIMRSVQVPIPTLNVTAMIEGLCNGTTMVSDTVTVKLHNVSSPYGVIDSKKVLLNTAGQGTLYMTSAADATNYYIAISHRNAVETWSSTGQAFSSYLLNYDFTTASSKAYSDGISTNLPMKQVGSKWCFWSGEVTNNYFIEFDDLIQVYNFYLLALEDPGYYPEDLNYNGYVEFDDVVLEYNNYTLGIWSQNPLNPVLISKPLKQKDVNKITKQD